MSDIEVREWATAPLLDPANVGRWVWHSWNSNCRRLVRVDDVKRTIIVGSTRYRVEPDGDEARSSSQWPAVIFTESRRSRYDARVDLLRQVHSVRFGVLSDEQLRAIIEIATREAAS